MQTIPTAGSRMTCRSCGQDVSHGEPFCAGCGQVQPLQPDVSYFDIFALPPKLGLDPAALEQQFYRASRKLHPDAHAQASQQEQEWSLAQTSLLNDAYRTLKSPVERTKYLLKLEGVQVEDDQQPQGGSPASSKPPEDLLEEVFDLNMQLEEQRANQKMGEDDPQLRADLKRSKGEFGSRLSAVDQELGRLWTAWDESIEQNDATKRSAAKESMIALLQRRSYLRNLVRDVTETLGES